MLPVQETRLYKTKYIYIYFFFVVRLSKPSGSLVQNNRAYLLVCFCPTQAVLVQASMAPRSGHTPVVG